MTAMPPSFPGTCLQDAAHDSQTVAVLRWHALVEAGDLVAALAGEDAAPIGASDGDIEELIVRAQGWRRERAEVGLADLAAVMEPGLAALLAIRARGADPRPAAQALWREFAGARGAILGLVSPAGAAARE